VVVVVMVVVVVVVVVVTRYLLLRVCVRSLDPNDVRGSCCGQWLAAWRRRAAKWL
jgi:hypothetical protein